jgi:hypothetical protein
MSIVPMNPILKSETTVMSSSENLKNIENHKKAAQHLGLSAKHHLEAATFHEAGNHEKASESTIKAHGHHSLANEAQKEDVRQHAFHK